MLSAFKRLLDMSAKNSQSEVKSDISKSRPTQKDTRKMASPSREFVEQRIADVQYNLGKCYEDSSKIKETV